MSRIFTAILWCFLCASAMAQTSLPPPAASVFLMSASRTSVGDLQLSWKILPGYYLYRDRFAFTPSDGQPLKVKFPPGETKDDPNFGPTTVYHQGLEVTLPAKLISGQRNLQVRFQGCAEQGICYPPVEKSVDPATLMVSNAPISLADDSVSRPQPPTQSSASADKSRSDLPAPVTASPGDISIAGNILWTMLAFLGFGVLLAATPCIFPMIPILSGMLARSGERLSPARSFILSSSYALAVGCAYGALGLLAAWSGQNFQATLQTPIALGAMAAVLLTLALSMLGLFDLQLPPAIANRLTSQPHARGSIFSAALLGFGSALIVGPCVTPPLAAALLYATQTGDALKGALALFALGLGMGLPLVLFGTLGGAILPRSGPWLVRVKQAFGIVFIYLAVLMVSRALPDNLAVALWGVTASFGGGWLVVSALSRRADGLMRIAGGAGFPLLAYGVILLVGYASGATDPFEPLTLHAALSGQQVTSSATTVTSLDELKPALDKAQTIGKPILIDFTAAWCTTCRDFERNVLARPDVEQRLRNVTMIRVDATHYDKAIQSVMTQYRVAGPPTLFMLDPSSLHEVSGTRSIGELTSSAFLKMLNLSGA